MDPTREIEELEQLLDTLIAEVTQAFRSGEVLSEEFLLNVANEINLTNNRIKFLSRSPTEEIEELEQLLDTLVAEVTQAFQSGEVLSEEFLLNVANEINLTNNRIEFLSRSIGGPGIPAPQPRPPPVGPGVDRAPHPSSNINAFRYDPDSRQLLIKFHGKDTADSGPVYRYKGVPPNIYDVFRRGAVAPRTSGSNRYHTWHRGVTPSHGASAYALIKEGGYQYQRMS